jgi:hypothetical protein
MNFLNPFVLIGMAAAGIPLLLHLLNLRKLRVVEFSTLQFLHELQQTRVRKIRIQQILLLILRTLIIICAVFAFARPTIPSTLPLLGMQQRTSVVLLIDNSASMEAADQRGVRLRQAKSAALSILDGLKDGDEVAVLPLAGPDPTHAVSFTRTFAIARDEIERLALSDARAELPAALRHAQLLLDDASEAHREIYAISDAQASLTVRPPADTSILLRSTATVFLVRIGNGQDGLEQNISVDSLHVLTALFQPDRPIEVETFVRNGSTRDASGVIVTLTFDGVRVAQRAVDIPAGATRSTVISAPAQRRGMVAVSTEVENDAIDRDNTRYAGVLIPPRARVALVGAPSDVLFARTALRMPGTEADQPTLDVYPTLAAVLPSLASLDVVIVCGGDARESDAVAIRQFVEGGGGVLLFASKDEATSRIATAMGMNVTEPQASFVREPWKFTSVERAHPLFQGVFKGTTDPKRIVESPTIQTMRAGTGGQALIQTAGGTFLMEVLRGNGRFLYCAVPPTMAWSTLPTTGLFPTLMVRSVLYLMMPRDQGVQALLGEPVSAPIPPRYAAQKTFRVVDATGIIQRIDAVPLPSGAVVRIPGQERTGVIKVSTEDSNAVMTVAVNMPTDESQLTYLENETWKTSVRTMVTSPDLVAVVDAGTSIRDEVQRARTGSELWPLFIALALLFALTEMAVVRFGAVEKAA